MWNILFSSLVCAVRIVYMVDSNELPAFSLFLKVRFRIYPFGM